MMDPITGKSGKAEIATNKNVVVVAALYNIRREIVKWRLESQ